MKLDEILKYVDHTNLSVTASFSDIKKLLDEGIKYNTASVCIAPCHVKRAREYAKDRLKICTVIGFPNGYNTLESKVFETKDAILNGADEIDMVINIGMLKEGRFSEVEEEIAAVRAASKGKILKVIIETCLLDEKEKIKMCRIVSDSGADFIKTSTGFSQKGAEFCDIELFKKHCENGVKIKAAGGILSLSDAEKFIELGAERLGTSRIVKIAEEML